MHHASPAIFSVGHLTCCWAKRWLRPHTQLKSMRPRHHTNSFRNGTCHQQNRETWLEYLGIYPVYWNRCSQLIPIQNCPKYFPDFLLDFSTQRAFQRRNMSSLGSSWRRSSESGRRLRVPPWKWGVTMGKKMLFHRENDEKPLVKPYHISIILWWMMNYDNIIIIYIIHQPNNNTIFGIFSRVTSISNDVEATSFWVYPDMYTLYIIVWILSIIHHNTVCHAYIDIRLRISYWCVQIYMQYIMCDHACIYAIRGYIVGCESKQHGTVFRHPLLKKKMSHAAAESNKSTTCTGNFPCDLHSTMRCPMHKAFEDSWIHSSTVTMSFNVSIHPHIANDEYIDWKLGYLQIMRKNTHVIHYVHHLQHHEKTYRNSFFGELRTCVCITCNIYSIYIYYHI